LMTSVLVQPMSNPKIATNEMVMIRFTSRPPLG
jgi:hypothetical protein